MWGHSLWCRGQGSEAPRVRWNTGEGTQRNCALRAIPRHTAHRTVCLHPGGRADPRSGAADRHAAARDRGHPDFAPGQYPCQGQTALGRRFGFTLQQSLGRRTDGRKKWRSSWTAPCPWRYDSSLAVKDRNQGKGLPRTASLTSSEVTEAIEEPLSAIITTIRFTVEQTPLETGCGHY